MVSTVTAAALGGGTQRLHQPVRSRLCRSIENMLVSSCPCPSPFCTPAPDSGRALSAVTRCLPLTLRSPPAIQEGRLSFTPVEPSVTKESSVTPLLLPASPHHCLTPRRISCCTRDTEGRALSLQGGTTRGWPGEGFVWAWALSGCQRPPVPAGLAGRAGGLWQQLASQEVYRTENMT